ncbi:response regulator transcription factor [Terrabacter sp. Ter38]|uniref:response regulator transcription factor n=1 Tax=Terrabacter sp. Ter38 TaxID=2926030 RepID=UPI002117900D|nr:response regulator transcription factor [Terrabacter sp. Ter38]
MTDDQRRPPIRVMLVDDDPVARTGRRFMLGAAGGLEVTAEVSDGDEMVGAIQARRPDVVVLDVRMARVGGIEAIAAIKARPEARRC